MKNPKKPKTYEEERDVWYKKLKDAGFEDIEQDEYYLKQWSSRFLIKTTAALREAKQAYYQMAEHFLEVYEFGSEFDKIIWTYHASGLSDPEISDTLKKINVSIHRRSVNRVVTRLVKIMKEVMVDTDWSDEQ